MYIIDIFKTAGTVVSLRDIHDIQHIDVRDTEKFTHNFLAFIKNKKFLINKLQ